MVGKGGNFQEGVDGRQERNEENGKEFEELCRRNCSVRLEIHCTENEIGDDEHNGCGDHLVEGVLDERLEPSPEDPFEFGNDEERYEDWTDEDAYRCGDKPIGDDNNGDGLCSGKKNGDCRLNQRT